MRLTSFRVKKYRSIEDSGEIKIDENITTFVGINESGKTNLLRALKKINHVEDTDFDDLTENPIWHFGHFDPNEIFVTATFKLDDNEKQHVNEISNEQLLLNEIKFSKKKNMKLICHLDYDQEAIHFDVFYKNYLKSIFELLNTIDPETFDNGKALKTTIMDIFNKITQGIENELNIRQPHILEQIQQNIKNLKNQLGTIPDKVLDKNTIQQFLDRINSEITEDSSEEIKNFLIKQLPRFIYFENIGIIDSRIRLSNFINKINNNDLDEDEKTAKTLLDLGSLNAHELVELSKDGDDHNQVQKNKDRLDLILSYASKKVSEEINSIWTQNDHDIEFSVQGDNLRVWVINKKDKTKLQLEERSRGYQWYFSFYVVFNVESEQKHKNAILLLDEPALFLHAVGQEDFLKNVLPTLAEKNQILYTTHSPFMVDMKKPDSIHTVTLKESKLENGIQKLSNISNDVWDSDRDALFPLQSALHYNMAQSLFIGKNNLIVEGITDFWLLSSASSLLESAGKIHLKDNFVFVPVGGAMRSILFASMYKSQNLDVAILLDADQEGKKAYGLIVKKKIVKNKKIFMINEIFDKTKNMSIEDMFPEDYYLQFVQSTYKNELQKERITQIILDSQKPMIVNRIEDFFLKNNLGDFHKNRPNRAILKQFSETNINLLPNELIQNFETLFNKINDMIST